MPSNDPDYYCYLCRKNNNGPQQAEDHFGLTPGTGGRHRKAVKKAWLAVSAGSVLRFSNDSDPPWVIGAKNVFSWFDSPWKRFGLQRYICLCCSRGWEQWGAMVAHLSTPKTECAAYAHEQRRRHEEISSVRRHLRRCLSSNAQTRA